MDNLSFAGQLDVLRTQLSGCGNGHGGAVAIAGPVATGKTTLLEHFKNEAIADGAIVLSATASRSEHLLPLGVFGQLFHDPLITPLDIQAEMWSERISDTMIHEDDDSLPRRIVSLLEELRGILISLCKEKCVLICIDDFHRADLLSIRSLSYLIRRVASLKVLAVLTGIDSLSAEYRTFADVIREMGCTVVRVGPLALDDVFSIITEQAGSDVAQRLAIECFKATGGNQLLMNGLLSDNFRSMTKETLRLVYDVNFKNSARSYVSRLSKTEIVVASVLATMDSSVSVDLIAEILEMPRDEVNAHLEVLSESGIVRHGKVCHGVLRDILLDFLPREKRESLNLRAAQIIYEHDWPATAVAHHLASAGSRPGEWAIPVLCEAASRMMEKDISLSIKYLRIASKIITNEKRRAEITVLLMRTEWEVSPTAAARHLPTLERSIVSGQLGVCDSIVAMEHMLWNGQVKRAKRIIYHLERKVHTFSHDEALCVIGMSQYLWYCYPTLRLSERFLDSVSAGETSSPGKGHSVLHEVIQILRRGVFHWLDDEIAALSYRMIRRTPPTAETMTSILAAITALIVSDNLGMIATLFDQGVKELSDGGASTRLALFSAIHAVISYRRGDLISADEQARRALDVITTQSWGVAVGFPLAVMIHVKIAKNELDAAASFLRIPVPEIMFYTPIGVLYREARGLFYRVTGRQLSAIADFRHCGDLMTKWGIDFAGFLQWRVELAQAYLELGHVDQASRLADELSSVSYPVGTRAKGTELRLQAALSDPENRIEILLRAIRCFSECGDKFSTALALGEICRAWMETSREHEAQVASRRAYRIARECGTKRIDHLQFPWPESGAKRADDVDQSVHTQAASLLSSAERRVAELACERTNSQIASELHITVSTVEQHLTHVYRKLGISRRVELRQRLCTLTTSSGVVSGDGESGEDDSEASLDGLAPEGDAARSGGKQLPRPVARSPTIWPSPAARCPRRSWDGSPRRS